MVRRGQKGSKKVLFQNVLAIPRPIFFAVHPYCFARTRGPLADSKAAGILTG
jgi:hypothetical protein